MLLHSNHVFNKVTENWLIASSHGSNATWFGAKFCGYTRHRRSIGVLFHFKFRTPSTKKNDVVNFPHSPHCVAISPHTCKCETRTCFPRSDILAQLKFPEHWCWSTLYTQTLRQLWAFTIRLQGLKLSARICTLKQPSRLKLPTSALYSIIVFSWMNHTSRSRK
jgi:hypothetical protein